MNYDNETPMNDKFLMADGSIRNANGQIVQGANEYWKQRYKQATPIPAKFLHADGTIDENIGGGGGSGITVEPITITQNGTTTAPSGKAYSPITVNVQKEVVLNVPVLPDGFTIRKEASQGGSVVISSPTAFSFFSVEPERTYKNGGLDVTEGSLGNVDRGSYICIFRDSNYNILIGMGRWRDYEALTN